MQIYEAKGRRKNKVLLLLLTKKELVIKNHLNLLIAKIINQLQKKKNVENNR